MSDSFGDRFERDGDGLIHIPRRTQSAYRGRYEFKPHESEVDPALIYNRARYYDPTPGRWLSKEPLGFEPGEGSFYPYARSTAARK